MDIFTALIITFIVLIVLFRKLKKVNSTKIKLLYIALVVIHSIAFGLNYYVNIDLKKDAYIFFTKALNANNITDFSFLGSQFMSVIVYPFAKLGFSFFSISLLFSTLSLYTFYKYLNYLQKKYNIDDSKSLIFILILFLMPSLHFWTAGLTKEALVFYLMSVVFFQTLKSKIISFQLVLSLIFILLIRPYLFGIVLLTYSIFVLRNQKVQKKNKIQLILLTLLAITLSLPVLKGFLKVDSLNIEGINKSFQHIIEYSQNNGASSINLENSTYFYRMFLVLFKPLFYDARTFFQYIISIENLILLIILFKFIVDVIKKKALKFIFKEQFFLSLTVILLILFFSTYLYNLGLASRMRVMFLPYLFLLMFNFYTKANKKKCDEEKSN
ncbi:hypothetical protein [Lacinutrix sp. Bg11-31]|uniref:hypothetical protein n=1 Tax=Lacinutrix sp. Bg11-31 TaxID=2057808 RepID=UPI000C31AAB4|nr:hypothetical protein [Lacinutrix sp. Bg11-31]AUC82945.1 hypothetical protein CW733_12745 [Lacinutrix sp. Bg11-31]